MLTLKDKMRDLPNNLKLPLTLFADRGIRITDKQVKEHIATAKAIGHPFSLVTEEDKETPIALVGIADEVEGLYYPPFAIANLPTEIGIMTYEGSFFITCTNTKWVYSFEPDIQLNPQITNDKILKLNKEADQLAKAIEESKNKPKH